VLRVGPVAITAHLTPGHKPGSTTWTWRSCEGSRCLDIVYADSLNAVSAPDFKYSSQPARVAAFRKSITLVAALPCDVMVSVHPEFSKLTEKIERHARGDANAFVDPNACRVYASSMLDVFEHRLADENK
jgi:metallo-beta-lactamase class B